MNCQYQAQPTRFLGRNFRSKLEAQWAVFLHKCGADFEYEPSYVDLGYGMRYSPDFLVHDVYGRVNGDIYIEVKGVMDQKSLYKIQHFEPPLLVVGNIPNDANNYHEEFVDQFDENESYFSCLFIDGDCWPCFPVAGIDGGICIQTDRTPYKYDYDATIDAYMTARIAQFEKPRNTSFE